MTDVTKQLGDTATEIAGLPGEIKGLRERGYAFAGYLENKCDVLAKQWDDIRQQVQQAVREEINRVQARFDAVAQLWPRLEGVFGNKTQMLEEIERGVAGLVSDVEAAHSRIEGMYGRVPENVSQTQAQIRQIQSFLKLADESSVTWTPAEALVMVHEAEWVKSGKGKEDPDGLLFVTDQRLIFERKEKVGGRFGFGGDKVQEELWAIPIGTISEVTPEDKGLFGGKDLIHLKLSSGDYAEMTLEIKSGGVDSKWYAGQLNRVLNGEIEKERAIPVDEAAAEAVRQAPTACPTCGATLPALVRGMTELTCEYCGTVVRV